MFVIGLFGYGVAALFIGPSTVLGIPDDYRFIYAAVLF